MANRKRWYLILRYGHVGFRGKLKGQRSSWFRDVHCFAMG